MPSYILAREGQGATLLIHEATMDDDQVEMARAKGHSTFGQAVGIGRRYDLRCPY
jgi:ribonuclease Z